MRRSGKSPSAPGALACALLVLTPAPAGGDEVDAAIEWVAALPGSRIYTDGYVPHEPPTPMTSEGQARMLPAALLDYYARAWNTFVAQAGLSALQREPKHYKIGHAIEGNELTVVVQGLRLPRIVDGRPEGVMRVSVGPSMRLRYALDTGRLAGTELLR